MPPFSYAKQNCPGIPSIKAEYVVRLYGIVEQNTVACKAVDVLKLALCSISLDSFSSLVTLTSQSRDGRDISCMC